MTKAQNPRRRRRRREAVRDITITHRVSRRQLDKMNELAAAAGCPRSHLIQWGILKALQQFKAAFNPSFSDIFNYRTKDVEALENADSILDLIRLPDDRVKSMP